MKKYSDVNIEFAHIYVDEILTKEYLDLARNTQKITEAYGKEEKKVVLSVLIDDYNPVTHELKIDEFLAMLKKEGVEPDFVLFESELTKLKDSVFELLNEGKIKRYYSKYINSKKHFPCSFLIVVWYFLRLGILDHDDLNFYVYNKNKSFKSEKILNVLQSKYRDVEKKAHDIIKISKVSEKLQDIEYRFL